MSNYFGLPNLDGPEAPDEEAAPIDRGATVEQIDQYNRRLAFAALVDSTYDEAKALLLAKHRAYGPRNISAAPGGPLNGLNVRMHDKLARLTNLLGNPMLPSEGTAGQNDESIRDTLLDLANYALIGVMVLDDGWPQA